MSMKKRIEITDIKLTGRSPALIRGFFIGASLILATTLFGATIASGFDATHIKITLAVLTLPAYAWFFLSGFCQRIELVPKEQTICFHLLLRSKPACYGFADVTAIKKKVQQEDRILYHLRAGRSKYTICTNRQRKLEKLFPDLF